MTPGWFVGNICLNLSPQSHARAQRLSQLPADPHFQVHFAVDQELFERSLAQKDLKASPEENAGPFSVCFFTWFSPIVKFCYNLEKEGRQLQMQDVPALPTFDATEKHYLRLKAEWDKELRWAVLLGCVVGDESFVLLRWRHQKAKMIPVPQLTFFVGVCFSWVSLVLTW